MIRRKKEITDFIKNFEIYADWDGSKHYLSINTLNPNGTLTIMKYHNQTFTYHRKNDLYWDINEIEAENDILIDIIWGFRKAINQSIKAKIC